MRPIKRTIFTATMLVALAAAVFVPGAAAHQNFETGMEYDGFPSGANLFIYGALGSDKAKCVSNRKVEFQFDSPDGFVTSDTDRSSEHGAFAVYGDAGEGGLYKIKVLRKRLPNGDVCLPTADTFT